MELEESARSLGEAASSRAAPPGARRVVSRERRAAAPNVLLVVAAQFSLPYRVLRCLAQAGANVIVLGRGAARGLRTSRCCRRYIECESQIDGRLNVELVREVNRVISAHSIDLVVAGDPLATRSLIELSKVLDAPCFPMPELDAFDLLNDKWRFTNLCEELGILCPKSRLFADGRQLLDEINRGALSLPIIAKPLSEDASRGCVSVLRPSDIKKVARITYGPIIVQEFILGTDIGASIFCRDGQIISYLIHDYYHGTYRAYSDLGIYVTLAKVAGHLHLDGIYNFDMRLAASGDVFFLECNPRVFFKCAMSMVAGINFLALGLPSGRPAETPSLTGPVAFQFPRNILRVLFTPWKFNRRTWRVVKLLLSDPVPYLREILGFEKGN